MDVPKEPKQFVKSIWPMISMRSTQEPVSVNVGAAVLRHFLSGEVRIGDSGATRLAKWWTFQLGPFATHTVKLEKKNRFSTILTLTVDDEVLVECSGEDLGSSPGIWQCKFRFVGE